MSAQDRARKLQALVDRGATPGERAAAQRALDAHRAKSKPTRVQREAVGSLDAWHRSVFQAVLRRWPESGHKPTAEQVGHYGQWVNEREGRATFTVERAQGLRFIRGEGVLVMLPSRENGRPVTFDCQVTGVVLPNARDEDATIRVVVQDVAEPAAGRMEAQA